MKSWAIRDVSACGAVVVIAILLYRKILRLWWMYDDPGHLRSFGAATLRDVFLPRAGNDPTFTPLLTLSLKGDLACFGTDARFFYVHQLVSLSLFIIALYCLLRLWCGRLPSAAAAIVAICGGPMLDVVPLLMTRHYIEGGIFAIVATGLFASTRERRISHLSALAYLLACAAKEIYVPLPALLFVIAKRRARPFVPHAVAAAIYAVWHVAAVGFDVKPYGAVADSWTTWTTLPLRIARKFAASGSAPAWIFTGLVLLCLAIVIVRVRESRPVAVVALVVALLPIIPVATQLEGRFVFSFWILAAMAVAFLPRAWPRGGAALALVVAIVGIVAFRVEWVDTYRRLMRMSDEGRVLALLGPDDIVRNPLTLPTTMLELQKFAGTEARAIYDDYPLCQPGSRVGRIFEYDSARREVLETTRAGLDRSCASIVTRPMSVHIRFDSTGAMHWDLGPYSDGRWTFILIEGIAAWDVPQHGAYRWSVLNRMTLRVRYQSPGGWQTYSPLLEIDREKGLFVFERPVETPAR